MNSYNSDDILTNFEREYTRYKEKHSLDEADRKITEREQMAYWYRHHDFKGFTVKRTAFIMGITQRRVNQLLQSLKQKAPQLFPILTKQQADVLYLITELGLTHEQVGWRLLISEEAVAGVVRTLRKKDMQIRRRSKMDPKRFDIYIDGEWTNLEDLEGDDGEIITKF